MKRLPNLDALRFFLSVYVILIHTSQTSYNLGLPNLYSTIGKHKGNQAIAMFFVLSGFLIISIIYHAKNKGTFSIRNFYMRRVLKIFPLYYLIIIFGFFYYHIILPKLGVDFPIEYDLPEALFLTTFFLSNIFVRSYDTGGIFEVLWSIAIEEQFYIIIAPLLFYLRKAFIFKVLLALTLVYFFLFHIDNMQFLRTYKFEFFFIFSGGLMAILEYNKKLEFLKKSKLISIFSIIGVLVYFFTTLLDFENLAFYNFITCVLFSMFIHSISINNFDVEIKNKYINYLGEISYGLYLYHIIMLNLVLFVFLKLKSIKLFNDSVSLILIHVFIFGLTIFISHISFKYFESYFLRLKDKFRN